MNFPGKVQNIGPNPMISLDLNSRLCVPVHQEVASLLAFQLWLSSCFSLCSLQFREGFRGLLYVNFVPPLFWLPLFQDFLYNSSCSENSEFWPLALQPCKNETFFLSYSTSAGHQTGKALGRKAVSVCTFLISRAMYQFLSASVCCLVSLNSFC